jgi:hypothetical protein
MLGIEQKHNNPHNNSSSKQLFSFPRSQRFVPELKRQSPDAIYHHEIRNTQATFTFSKSKRMHTESSGKEVHSQHFYNIEGEIEKALKKKAGVRILYGREVVHCLSRTASPRGSFKSLTLLALATTVPIPKPSKRASPASAPSATT